MNKNDITVRAQYSLTYTINLDGSIHLGYGSADVQYKLLYGNHLTTQEIGYIEKQLIDNYKYRVLWSNVLS